MRRSGCKGEVVADEGRAASVATSCDEFVKPLVFGAFVACSYQAAPRRRNVVARFLSLLLGTAFRYVATSVPIPSIRLILKERDTSKLGRTIWIFVV
jgi:hypothetical protein